MGVERPGADPWKAAGGAKPFGSAEGVGHRGACNGKEGSEEERKRDWQPGAMAVGTWWIHRCWWIAIWAGYPPCDPLVPAIPCLPTRPLMTGAKLSK